MDLLAIPSGSCANMFGGTATTTAGANGSGVQYASDPASNAAVVAAMESFYGFGLGDEVDVPFSVPAPPPPPPASDFSATNSSNMAATMQPMEQPGLSFTPSMATTASISGTAPCTPLELPTSVMPSFNMIGGSSVSGDASWSTLGSTVLLPHSASHSPASSPPPTGGIALSMGQCSLANALGQQSSAPSTPFMVPATVSPSPSMVSQPMPMTSLRTSGLATYTTDGVSYLPTPPGTAHAPRLPERTGSCDQTMLSPPVVRSQLSAATSAPVQDMYSTSTFGMMPCGSDGSQAAPALQPAPQYMGSWRQSPPQSACSTPIGQAAPPAPFAEPRNQDHHQQQQQQQHPTLFSNMFRPPSPISPHVSDPARAGQSGMPGMMLSAAGPGGLAMAMPPMPPSAASQQHVPFLSAANGCPPPGPPMALTDDAVPLAVAPTLIMRRRSYSMPPLLQGFGMPSSAIPSPAATAVPQLPVMTPTSVPAVPSMSAAAHQLNENNMNVGKVNGEFRAESNAEEPARKRPRALSSTQARGHVHGMIGQQHVLPLLPSSLLAVDGKLAPAVQVKSMTAADMQLEAGLQCKAAKGRKRKFGDFEDAAPAVEPMLAPMPMVAGCDQVEDFFCQQLGLGMDDTGSGALLSDESDEAARPFVCSHPPCTARFSRNHDLKRHERIHTGEKKWRCTECGRAFGRRDALARHTSAPGGKCKAVFGKRRMNRLRRLTESLAQARTRVAGSALSEDNADGEDCTSIDDIAAELDPLDLAALAGMAAAAANGDAAAGALLASQPAAVRAMIAGNGVAALAGSAESSDDEDESGCSEDV